MRDRLAHRGPDAAGLLERSLDDAGLRPWLMLGHRRLTVVDPAPEAKQPMLSACGRFAIAYNGELYNDAELRRELARCGAALRTRSDTETVLAALAAWGQAALPMFRGMYALALADLRDRTILLARDPLGIKPMCYHLADGVLAAASEPSALLASGLIAPRADPVALAAYLMTIRTTIGARTLLAGVRTLLPGEWVRFETGPDGEPRETTRGVVPPASVVESDETRSARHTTREIVTDAVRRHLRADVPICGLLSGGLDSTIIASVAARELGSLHTYCSGSPGGEDFAFARAAADALGTRHTDVPVTRELFARRVPEMVAALAWPLSTPNEVAIHEVARAMRADGMIVTLSGEGADELFGGYDGVLEWAARAEAQLDLEAPDGETRASRLADAYLATHTWSSPASLPRVLARGLVEAEPWEDARAEYRALLASARRPGDPLHAHLVLLRSINLEGLLRRLDTATMLAGVEGRTPIADAVVCAAAEMLPDDAKFRAAAAGEPARTKIALREAFAADIPSHILRRPKASFPLPFQEWVADLAPIVRESVFLRNVLAPGVADAVAAQPAERWRLAWPLVNLALWAEATRVRT